MCNPWAPLFSPLEVLSGNADFVSMNEVRWDKLRCFLCFAALGALTKDAFVLQEM